MSGVFNNVKKLSLEDEALKMEVRDHLRGGQNRGENTLKY